MLAVLYDIHGNVAALDAVLADARALRADRFIIGGDVVAFGPRPEETLARLHGLDEATWIRGNTDRWLVETPLDRPELWRALHETRVRLEWEHAEWLYARATRETVNGVLYVHASPLSDIASFDPAARDEDARLLAGERDATIAFGHTHKQFAPRRGPNGTTLLNPGSVGQPLDDDPRAAYALFDGSEFELRRVEYDHRAAASELRALGEWSEPFARRIEFATT